jgi:hypothetical protein
MIHYPYLFVNYLGGETVKEIAFSIPVSGVVRINEDSIVIIVNQTETSVSLSPVSTSGKRLLRQQGKTIFDLVLEAARTVVRNKGVNRFSPPELYQEALKSYPDLKKNSFMARVIACAPNHPSYKHHSSRRDYLSYLGPGAYTLNDQYKERQDSLQNVDVHNMNAKI